MFSIGDEVQIAVDRYYHNYNNIITNVHYYCGVIVQLHYNAIGEVCYTVQLNNTIRTISNFRTEQLNLVKAILEL